MLRGILIIISGRFLNTIDHLQPTYIGQKTGLGSSCGLKAGILLSRPLLVKVIVMIVVKVMVVVVVKVMVMVALKVKAMIVTALAGKKCKWPFLQHVLVSATHVNCNHDARIAIVIH